MEGCTATHTRSDKVPNEDFLNDEIVAEHLTRNIQLFGLESQREVTASYVVVIGLGGVGSYAASMLLRSGVGKLLLVDVDQVRHRLRKDHGIEGGIPFVFSLEKPKVKLLPFKGVVKRKTLQAIRLCLALGYLSYMCWAPSLQYLDK